MFLHLSKQCLDEGGLASSNLTHHSHQLTWFHRKIQPVHHNKNSDAIPIIIIYFFNVALSESSESQENVLSVIVTATSPSIKM